MSMPIEQFVHEAKRFFESPESGVDFFQKAIKKLLNIDFKLTKKELSLKIKPELLWGLGMSEETQKLFENRALFRFTNYGGVIFYFGPFGSYEEQFFGNNVNTAILNPDILLESIIEHMTEWTNEARKNRTELGRLGLDAFGIGATILFPLKDDLALVMKTCHYLDVYVVKLPDGRSLSSNQVDATRQVLNGKIVTFKKDAWGGTEQLARFFVRPPSFFYEDTGINHLEWQYMIPKGVLDWVQENPDCLKTPDEVVGASFVNVNENVKRVKFETFKVSPPAANTLSQLPRPGSF